MRLEAPALKLKGIFVSVHITHLSGFCIILLQIWEILLRPLPRNI
jgi:nitrogen fixation protein